MSRGSIFYIIYRLGIEFEHDALRLRSRRNSLMLVHITRLPLSPNSQDMSVNLTVGRCLEG